jgi:hypothetical protein
MKSAQEFIESTISPSAAEEIQSLSLSLSSFTKYSSIPQTNRKNKK